MVLVKLVRVLYKVRGSLQTAFCIWEHYLRQIILVKGSYMSNVFKPDNFKSSQGAFKEIF